MSQALPSVQIPKANTIRLYNILNEKAFCEPDEWASWVQPVKYEQIFSRFDTLAFQIKVENDLTWSMVNTITCKAYDINGLLAYTFTVTPLSVTGLDGWFYYEVREVLTVLQKGVYQLRINIDNHYGGPYQHINGYDFYSEPVYVEDFPKDTVIIKYFHENNNLGLLTNNTELVTVSGVTWVPAMNQNYINTGLTYNGEILYQSLDGDYLLFFSTTKYPSEWILQINGTTTPSEVDILGAHCMTLIGTYTNFGSMTGVVVIDYVKYYFYHRVKGGFDTNDFSPASKDVVYRDQRFDLTQLDSLPLDTTKLTIGDGGGIPNWQAGIINRILSCSYMNISGRKYVKNEGVKLEKVSEKNYPMMGWKIDLADETNEMENTYNGYDYNGDFYNDFLINI